MSACTDPNRRANMDNTLGIRRHALSLVRPHACIVQNRPHQDQPLTDIPTRHPKDGIQYGFPRFSGTLVLMFSEGPMEG